MNTIIKLTLGMIFSFPLAASTTLFIGDSQSMGPFGQEFDRLLRTTNQKVISFASCGTTPQQWFNRQAGCGLVSRNRFGIPINHGRAATPSIVTLLKRHQPNIVVMQFGGNFTGVRDDNFIINSVQRIVKTVKDTGAKCYWINNPDKRKGRAGLQRVWDLMENAVGNDCAVFKSQLVTRYPDVDANNDGKLDGDGLHYSFPAGRPVAREWARRAFEDYLIHFP